MIHIGKVIEKVLRDQGKTVTWFARSLYCGRTNVYKIFQRESVDSEMLYRISKILSHDFFKYYSKELEEDTEEI
ncbi:XRE family transcriptional regulator [Bacteroides sp. OF04-15BH]|uniref:XRE family transcriptional regulator n=1 Tax=Bacteroides sp. OF04-15BH TaxID=2292281 RepID=UPI000E471012|nr:XRE family transcriptional regulator [Bacteroides sp. OF04-15BH]RHP63683.1 XRE family transcriptional regulator [Bacteroides sp. OF04-15BH]